MSKVTLKSYLKSTTGTGALSNLTSVAMSNTSIKKTFDIDAERSKVMYIDEGELANFVADEIDYQENQDIPISYLIKMLDESSISSFSLGNTGKGFSVNIKANHYRVENNEEVIERISKTLKQADEDNKETKERFKQYKALQKEFGNI